MFGGPRFGGSQYGSVIVPSVVDGQTRPNVGGVYGSPAFGQSEYGEHISTADAGTATITGASAQGLAGTIVATGGSVAPVVTTGGGGFGWKRKQDAWLRKRATATIVGASATGRAGFIRPEVMEELSEQDLADIMEIINSMNEVDDLVSVTSLAEMD